MNSQELWLLRLTYDAAVTAIAFATAAIAFAVAKANVALQ